MRQTATGLSVYLIGDAHSYDRGASRLNIHLEAAAEND
jgi:hypothetical protein